MRILLVLFGHRIDARIIKELQTLHGAGHETHVLGMLQSDKPQEEMLHGAHVHRRLSMPRGLWRFPLNLYFRFNFRSFILERELQRLITEIRPDAVHVADLPACRSVLRVTRPLHIPVVADFHERFPDLIMESRDMGGLQGLKNRILLSYQHWLDYESSVLRSADHVLCTSPAIMRLYADLGISPDKLHLVMNTVSLEDFDSFPRWDVNLAVSGEKGRVDVNTVFLDESDSFTLRPRLTGPGGRDHFVLGYVGGMFPHRGVKVAIEAMVGLLKRCPQARLVIVGGGPMRPAFHALTTRLNLGDAVLFVGWQPSHLLPAYMACFDVCVLAQQDTPHNRLVLSNKIFEYMAARRPVIVSDVGETARIVRETWSGLVFRPNDPEDFVLKTLELYQDPDLRRQLGEKGREAVEQKYNWKESARTLCTVYDSLCKHKSRDLE